MRGDYNTIAVSKRGQATFSFFGYEKVACPLFSRYNLLMTNTKSAPKKSGTRTIFWWVTWITLTIVSFFAAAAFWTPWIAKHLGSIHSTKNSVIWVTAVFGTWMLFLVPLIIVMYSKVDKVYEDARLRRENAALQFRSILIARDERLLPKTLRSKLSGVPETIEGGHLVRTILKDGREVPYVFVANQEEILGVYDCREMPFQVSEIKDIFPESLETLPAFLQTKWLRLDGVKAE